MDIHAVKKMYAANLLKETAAALSVGKEWLALQESKDMRLSGMSVRKAVTAALADDWSDLTEKEELNPWMMAKLKNSVFQARQEADQRKSSVQQVLQGCTDFFEADHRASARAGRVTLSYECPRCHRFPLEDYIWCVSSRHGDGSKSKN